MKLIAYPTQPAALTPEIRPAPSSRVWMDELPAAYGYRCLPLTIANSHGWEITCPEGFEAVWNGRTGKDAITLRFDGVGGNSHFVISHFGSGVLTFHTGYLFRTDPGLNLWASGPPNAPKDALQPLTGMIETDWAPYTFTMNWIFTRANHPVRFEKGDPFCFFFPVGRGIVDATEPEIRNLEDDPEARKQYEQWNQSRRGFLDELPKEGSNAHAERWQKGYYRGLQPDGAKAEVGHQTKIHARPFRRTE